MTSTDILPTEKDLRNYFLARYGDVRNHGWRVRLRHWFGYLDSDDRYEATLDHLVARGCSWIDVGGGKSILPRNKTLSEALCQRCAFVVGVDPSDNIHENMLVHERAQCRLEDYRSDRPFDLATFRMVAEHIEQPESVVASLARLVKPGGRVVIYTPNRRSPVPLAAAVIPFWLHHPIASVLWESSAEDVFPTLYRMNTRRRLRSLFEQGGFHEVAFAYLDNVTTFQRFRLTCFLELCFWRIFRSLGLGYPENNLLGVYESMGEQENQEDVPRSP